MVIVLSLPLSFFDNSIVTTYKKRGGGVWIQTLVLLIKETKLARLKLKYNSLMLQCTFVPADE